MNRMTRKLWIGALFLVMAGFLPACNVLGTDSNPGPTATPAVLTNSMLRYVVPLYSLTMNPGDRVPGTQIYYEQRNGDNYELVIDGQPAVKRTGDSLFWRGILAPGVAAEYNLRISPSFRTETMLAAGPIEVTVLNAAPVEVDITADIQTASINFSLIPIERNILVGEQMVGTSIIYQGQTAQGALLGGISGHPYRAAGDSLVWTGRLRGNVAATYNLRVVSYSAENLRLVGSAELWITPNQ